MSRSCFTSFPLCVYKFSSHYLNNVIFYRQYFGAYSERLTLFQLVLCYLLLLSTLFIHSNDVFVRLFHAAASTVLKKKKKYERKRDVRCDRNITDNLGITQSFASALDS